PTPTPPHTYTLSLHDALPISVASNDPLGKPAVCNNALARGWPLSPGYLARNSGRATNASANATLLASSSAGDFGPPTSAMSGMKDRKSTRLNSSHLVISYAVF